jgi:hypothetical protein
MVDEIIRQADFAKLLVSRTTNDGSSHCERAAQLRAQAARETNDRLRNDLLRMADQYEGLAAVLG